MQCPGKLVTASGHVNASSIISPVLALTNVFFSSTKGAGQSKPIAFTLILSMISSCVLRVFTQISCDKYIRAQPDTDGKESQCDPSSERPLRGSNHSVSYDTAGCPTSAESHQRTSDDGAYQNRFVYLNNCKFFAEKCG